VCKRTHDEHRRHHVVQLLLHVRVHRLQVGSLTEADALGIGREVLCDWPLDDLQCEV
jgi:hypothetical protein